MNGTTRREIQEFARKLARYGVPVPFCQFKQVENKIEVSVSLPRRFSRLVVKHLKLPGKPIVIKNQNTRLTIPVSHISDERKVKDFALQLKQVIAGGLA